MTADALRVVFAAGWRVCPQMPLVLGQATDPLPDVAVVRGSARGTAAHRKLLVFRDPAPLPAGLGATAYRTRPAPGPAAPAATVRVADLLP